MKKLDFDIDIDVGNRDEVLKHFDHVPAVIDREGRFQKHNTGVYFTDIPYDENGVSTIDYKEAENRGYFKVDILNVHVYQHVKNEEHLEDLLNKTPPWDRLKDKAFFEQVIHLGENYGLMQKMPEPIDSIPRLAMFLAIIRPGKKHLIGKPWKDVAQDIWTKPDDDSYFFKKAHGVAYAHLVVVHMNLLVEQGK